MNKSFFRADVLERYISLVLDSYIEGAKQSRGHYNFRCNVCGDSKKKKSKRRAWILTNQIPWRFYCHNCQESMPVEIWLKIYFNSFYMDYMKEVYKIDMGETPAPPPPIKKVELTGQEYNEHKDVQYFKPIFSSDADIFQVARKECARRLIPLEVWKKWFVSTGGTFKDRLIIPYRDNEGKIYSYQGRSLRKQEPKYLSRINCTDNIYNYYTVDPNKPVVILEGAIDSVFIENAIGCTGLKIRDERLKKFPYRYFLLDYDEPGREMSLTLLKMREWVFCWKRFLYDNNVVTGDNKGDKEDINNFIMKTKRTTIIQFSELEKYFLNDIMYASLIGIIPHIQHRIYEEQNDIR